MTWIAFEVVINKVRNVLMSRVMLMVYLNETRYELIIVWTGASAWCLTRACVNNTETTVRAQLSKIEIDSPHVSTNFYFLFFLPFYPGAFYVTSSGNNIYY